MAPDASGATTAANGDNSDATNDDCGDAKENADSQQVVKQVVIEYVLRHFPLLNCLLHLQNVPERMWHDQLAHLTEELDDAEAESAISNESELLNSTYMEDSREQESDLEWMKCLLVLIAAQQDREKEKMKMNKWSAYQAEKINQI
ncbi:hypothetical protein OIU79_028019 [Salix purpurea]|uniref:Uncharacterized protein n=1 Tax=Salix purpurea TaxID=77065 RepID=A0A9Q0VWA0_SALPP|nr:hypothetical protein OIU79_028019 [Salix purpurea]